MIGGRSQDEFVAARQHEWKELDRILGTGERSTRRTGRPSPGPQRSIGRSART